ncbi:hypothetical protein PUR59_12715 [Streptomyces sp. SP18ES09]|nr:hypothetical protein [Streptomyces sp. SP18ES09]MEE1815868.1 hypothetical protein [Streptomyces sp. SP18ES09]
MRPAAGHGHCLVFATSGVTAAHPHGRRGPHRTRLHGDLVVIAHLDAVA